jgi:hypothetical protein
VAIVHHAAAAPRGTGDPMGKNFRCNGDLSHVSGDVRSGAGAFALGIFAGCLVGRGRRNSAESAGDIGLAGEALTAVAPSLEPAG